MAMEKEHKSFTLDEYVTEVLSWQDAFPESHWTALEGKCSTSAFFQGMARSLTPVTNQSCPDCLQLQNITLTQEASTIASCC